MGEGVAGHQLVGLGREGLGLGLEGGGLGLGQQGPHLGQDGRDRCRPDHPSPPTSDPPRRGRCRDDRAPAAGPGAAEADPAPRPGRESAADASRGPRPRPAATRRRRRRGRRPPSRPAPRAGPTTPGARRPGEPGGIGAHRRRRTTDASAGARRRTCQTSSAGCHPMSPGPTDHLLEQGLGNAGDDLPRDPPQGQGRLLPDARPARLPGREQPEDLAGQDLRVPGRRGRPWPPRGPPRRSARGRERDTGALARTSVVAPPVVLRVAAPPPRSGGPPARLLASLRHGPDPRDPL